MKESTTRPQLEVIERMTMVAMVPVVLVILTKCVLQQISDCTDSYYMLKAGRQMLECGHIPNNMETPYGDIQTTWQNWLACVTYALAMDVGDILGIGHIAVRVAHIMEVMAMTATTVLIARRNKIGTLATILAVTVALSQYSIAKTRIHATTTTCLLICCEAAMSTMHDRERKRAWQISAIVACVVATNVQHMLAIAMPMAIAGIATLTPKTTRDARCETFALAAIATAVTVLMVPPEAGGILDGLTYKDTSKTMLELYSIPELLSDTDDPTKTYRAMTFMAKIVPVAISATILATKRDKAFPLAVMTMVASVMSFATTRNQQMLCALMTACIVCGTDESDEIRPWHIPLLVCLAGACLTNVTDIPKVMSRMDDPVTFMSAKGETERLGYPNRMMGKVPKGANVLNDMQVETGSWLYANGYLPSMTSKCEMYDMQNLQTNMLETRWDAALLYEEDNLTNALRQTEGWKEVDSMQTERGNMILFVNETDMTLAEQGLSLRD